MRYGVPAEVLVMILEMDIKYVSDVGFEDRREKWTRGLLLAAFKMLQNRDIDHAQIVGSSVGAMAQGQFLPSNYLVYEVDSDGDSLRNFWGSLAQ